MSYDQLMFLLMFSFVVTCVALAVRLIMYIAMKLVKIAVLFVMKLILSKRIKENERRLKELKQMKEDLESYHRHSEATRRDLLHIQRSQFKIK